MLCIGRHLPVPQGRSRGHEPLAAMQFEARRPLCLTSPTRLTSVRSFVGTPLDARSGTAIRRQGYRRSVTMFAEGNGFVKEAGQVSRGSANTGGNARLRRLLGLLDFVDGRGAHADFRQASCRWVIRFSGITSNHHPPYKGKVCSTKARDGVTSHGARLHSFQVY